MSASAPSVPRPGRVRLDRLALLLSLGILWLLVPYAFSETWRFSGLSPEFLPFYVWELAPFALLAALVVAVAADMGMSLLVTLNALRLLRRIDRDSRGG